METPVTHGRLPPAGLQSNSLHGILQPWEPVQSIEATCIDTDAWWNSLNTNMPQNSNVSGVSAGEGRQQQQQQQQPAAAAQPAPPPLVVGSEGSIETKKIKQVVLRLLSKIDLPTQAQRLVDPILLEALLLQYSCNRFEALWARSAAARAALTNIILDDIAIACEIHRGMVDAANMMPVCPASHLLASLSISLFLTYWNPPTQRNSLYSVAPTAVGIVSSDTPGL